MKVQEHISPIEQYVIDFVRKLRSDKKITQEDIANILEVSRSYIGDIESPNTRAKYNMTHVNALADYFNMSPQAFFPEKALKLSGSKIDKSSKAKSKKTMKKNK
ncbi:MAG: family transcriptional regulator [Ferruginibacter sp.]|nr:family transcriptional regulator [Ferruginibacter sp.]